MINSVFPGASVDWTRINYAHRDSELLKLNVKETTTATHIASVKQSDMEPGNLGEGAYDLQRELQRFSKAVAEE